MFTLPPDSLSEQHQMGRKGRKGKKDKKGQKGATSIKGAMMMLVEEDIPKVLGIKMGTTGMRETPDTIMMPRAIDQPGALKTGGIPPGSDKRCLLKTSDQQSEVLGGSPGTVEYLVDWEAKKDLEKQETYVMY